MKQLYSILTNCFAGFVVMISLSVNGIDDPLPWLYVLSIVGLHTSWAWIAFGFMPKEKP